MIIINQLKENIISLTDGYLIFMTDSMDGNLTDIYLKIDFYDKNIWLGSYSSNDTARAVTEQIYHSIFTGEDYYMPGLNDELLTHSDY